MGSQTGQNDTKPAPQVGESALYFLESLFCIEAQLSVKFYFRQQSIFLETSWHFSYR